MTTRIDRPTTPPAATPKAAPAAAPATPAATGAPAEAPSDRIKLSVDATVKLDDQHHPTVVLDDVEVDGVDVKNQVDHNMAGRRQGLRAQVTQKVVEAIAAQVATAITPVLEEKLETALTEQHLPPGLAHDLAVQTVPELAKIVAAKLAEQAKVSYSIGF
jgi:hypothetical protein